MVLSPSFLLQNSVNLSFLLYQFSLFNRYKHMCQGTGTGGGEQVKCYQRKLFTFMAEIFTFSPGIFFTWGDSLNCQTNKYQPFSARVLRIPEVMVMGIVMVMIL